MVADGHKATGVGRASCAAKVVLGLRLLPYAVEGSVPAAKRKQVIKDDKVLERKMFSKASRGPADMGALSKDGQAYDER